MDIGVREIREWHLDRGWSDIGYHYVIRRNGNIEEGRPESYVGAHTIGKNDRSLAICLVGGDTERGYPNFTRKQFETLIYLINSLLLKYPKATVHGHNEFTTEKTCPVFDVKEYWYGG